MQIVSPGDGEACVFFQLAFLTGWRLLGDTLNLVRLLGCLVPGLLNNQKILREAEGHRLFQWEADSM